MPDIKQVLKQDHCWSIGCKTDPGSFSLRNETDYRESGFARLLYELLKWIKIEFSSNLPGI